MQYCSGESKATRVQVSEPTDYLYYNALFHKQVGSVTEKEADAAIGALPNIEYVNPIYRSGRRRYGFEQG